MTRDFPTEVLFESFTFPFFDFNYCADHGAVAEAFMSQSDPADSVGRRGLYVHIPFCETICHFCPFIKSVGSPERVERYLHA
ncbi:hypothetical protein JYU02_00430, partial [bacterium AH-315-P15]|nr:hypothetical protein [bacterium AH-315-P15]